MKRIDFAVTLFESCDFANIIRKYLYLVNSFFANCTLILYTQNNKEEQLMKEDT